MSVPQSDRHSSEGLDPKDARQALHGLQSPHMLRLVEPDCRVLAVDPEERDIDHSFDRVEGEQRCDE